MKGEGAVEMWLWDFAYDRYDKNLTQYYSCKKCGQASPFVRGQTITILSREEIEELAKQKSAPQPTP
jgi:ribosomal protein S14